MNQPADLSHVCLLSPTIGCEVVNDHRRGAIGVDGHMLENMHLKVGRCPLAYFVEG